MAVTLISRAIGGGKTYALALVRCKCHSPPSPFSPQRYRLLNTIVLGTFIFGIISLKDSEFCCHILIKTTNKPLLHVSYNCLLQYEMKVKVSLSVNLTIIKYLTCYLVTKICYNI